MELIAASRIAKAQHRMQAASPYALEITQVLSALASKSTVEHPLVVPRERVRHAGVLVVTSDRGLAGGYNASALRTAEELVARLRRDGVEPKLYVIGRKGVGYYRFRNREIAASWTGFSEQPSYHNAREISETLVPLFLAGADGNKDNAEAGSTDPADTDGLDQLYLVSTRFRSMLTQEPHARIFAPLEVVEQAEQPGILPAYEFEPNPEVLLDSLLPRYVTTRIFAALLESAASESAARRRAMKAATDNATELIRSLTRESNQARQAEITQEISEIVGGADALASTGSDE